VRAAEEEMREKGIPLRRQADDIHYYTLFYCSTFYADVVDMMR